MKLLATAFFITTLMFTNNLVAQSSEDELLTQTEALQLGLFPPQVLIRMQDQLGVTEEQRNRMSVLLAEFNTKVAELQWTTPTEQQKLRALTMEQRVDTDAVINQVQVVMDLETRFKLAHFELLVAIKNELTAEQIETLNQTIRQRLTRARTQ